MIDHAWGWEPCTMAAIKAYKPRSSSLGSGQVLQCPYVFDQARLVVREMTDMLVLDLVEKRLMTDQLVLTVGYVLIIWTILKCKSIQRCGDNPIVMAENAENMPRVGQLKRSLFFFKSDPGGGDGSF